MGNRCINFHDLQGLITAVLFLHALNGTHIVQTVGQLDDNDTDILCHSDQHFTDIFRLLFLTGGIRYFTEFGNAVNQFGNFLSEQTDNFRQRNRCVLHDIMQ